MKNLLGLDLSLMNKLVCMTVEDIETGQKNSCFALILLPDICYFVQIIPPSCLSIVLAREDFPTQRYVVQHVLQGKLHCPDYWACSWQTTCTWPSGIASMQRHAFLTVTFLGAMHICRQRENKGLLFSIAFQWNASDRVF